MLQRKATFEPGPDLPDGKAQTDQQKSEDTGNDQRFWSPRPVAILCEQAQLSVQPPTGAVR